MQDEDFEMNVSGTFEENSIEPITAEKLKEETSIGGWLAFFLFAMMAGSIIGAVAMIAQFNRGEVGGNWLLALADPILGVLLFLLAFHSSQTGNKETKVSKGTKNPLAKPPLLSAIPSR